MRTVLTDISVRNLKQPETGQIIVTDTTFPGFGVRLTKGSKSYVLTYGAERRRVTLGAVGKVSLKDARRRAREILDHPTIPKTFREAHSSFMENHVRKLRPRSIREVTRLLGHFEALGPRQLASIKAHEFMAVIDTLKPVEGRHALQAIKTLLYWALHRELIDRHPLTGAKSASKPRSRERVLSDKEIAALLCTEAPRASYGALLTLLLLTGQRLSQIALFRHEWMEGDTVRFPADIMKSGKEHTIPVGPWARRLLEGWQPTKRLNWIGPHRAFEKASGLSDFTRHDLRRTFATGLANLDIPPHIIERLLDHRQTISGVAAIYNRARYEPQMRKAVEKWEAHLALLL